MGKVNKVTILGLVIGLIFSFSQPFYGWWFLVFPGFILLFLAVKISTKSSALFWLGYLAGLVYFLIDFKWYWAVYPLTNLGIENKLLAFVFVFLAWIITAGTMALTWGLLVWLFRKTDRHVSTSAFLIFPSIFSILEYGRSFLIALVWIGRQTPIGPYWTIGNLAYNFHNSFLVLKLASWFGLYGVLFLVIFLSLALFYFLEKRQHKKFLFLLLVIVVLFYWPDPVDQGRPCDKGRPCLEVAVIQTQIPSKPIYTAAEEVSNFKNQLELLDSVSRNFPKTKLIAFPEESNFLTKLAIFKNSSEASQYFANRFPEPVLILDNSKISEAGKFKARTIYLDTQKGILGSYDKYLITPGAEYVPWLFRGLDRVLGLNSPELQKINEYQTGGEWPSPIQGALVNRGALLEPTSLVCADIFSPNLARQALQQGHPVKQGDPVGGNGTNLLVSQSSFAFGNSPKDLISQDLAASKFRAAESGRYLIKSSNFGPSYIMADTGKLIKTTKNLDPQILTGSVVLKDNKTLYNKVGDNPVLLGALAVGLISLLWLRPKQ